MAERPLPERRTEIARALARYHARLTRKVLALRGDLIEAQRADELRAHGEALLAYLRQVPGRAEHVILPDPADPAKSLRIELDPRLSPHENAARLFKRAAKATRGLKEIPPRLSATEAEAHGISVLLARIAALEEGASDSALADDPKLDHDLEVALGKLSPALRTLLRAPGSRTGAKTSGRAIGRALPARLTPRRLKTREGWEVWIGRSNEGNDHLTHRLARPEDYWLHVHGAAGSHVVLRRGKSKSEPSKRTLEEVAAWAAYYSQARTAGRVPVIVTRKKYVRKPRKGPPGLALCTHEKSLIVRPAEPPREALESDS
jgi:predicted ribosome quality control (RQC) complex YloA/Tae2 family protein